MPHSKIHNHVPANIQTMVDDRGFAVYEWINPEELRLSIRADYLGIIQKSSIPLAVVTVIAGLIGFTTGSTAGIVLAVLAVLGVFYAIVFVILLAKMSYKAYLYARGADVILTDNHYVAGGKVFDAKNMKSTEKAIHAIESTFHEPMFQESQIQEYIKMQKASVGGQLKKIAGHGASVLDNLGGSRNGGAVVLILLIAGGLYALMMGLVYFAGVFFVALMARLVSGAAHRVLLWTHNKEHVIQSHFQSIHNASHLLETEKNRSVKLLAEAKANAWIDNLSGRIGAVFKNLDREANTAINQSVKLRKELKSSRYKDIFNFQKYDRWIRREILTPINGIIELLHEVRRTLTDTIISLEQSATKKPGDNFWGDTGQKALGAQKTRLEMQIESVDKMIATFALYQAKLEPKE